MPAGKSSGPKVGWPYLMQDHKGGASNRVEADLLLDTFEETHSLRQPGHC